jgi:hypothetical protein
VKKFDVPAFPTIVLFDSSINIVYKLNFLLYLLPHSMIQKRLTDEYHILLRRWFVDLP